MKKKTISYDKIERQTYSRAGSGEMLPDKKVIIRIIKHVINDYGGYAVTPMLTGSSQRYLSFILNNIDGFNEFATHKKKRQEFIEALNSSLGTTYKIDYVSRLLIELKGLGFIIRECQGVYFLNPLLYWRGLDKDREDKIKYMLNPASIDLDQDNINAAISLSNQVYSLLSENNLP